jgi:hypothetical protein
MSFKRFLGLESGYKVPDKKTNLTFYEKRFQKIYKKRIFRTSFKCFLRK